MQLGAAREAPITARADEADMSCAGVSDGPSVASSALAAMRKARLFAVDRQCAVGQLSRKRTSAEAFD